MTRTMRLLVVVGAVALVVLALAGRADDDEDPPDSAPTTTAAPATTPASTPTSVPTTAPSTSAATDAPTTLAPTAPADGGDGAALDLLLARLEVAEPDRTRPGYDRDAFEEGLDLDGDCLRTRHEVLAEESAVPVTLDGCRVVVGRWRDPLTGTEVTAADDLQVDHLVALADAWRSGAWAWSDDRRAAYANELGDPDHLNAVLGDENQRKADDGPDAYRPADPAAWCWYATAYARIKVTWDLTATPAQVAGLRALGDTCGTG